jgi:hypothetical protein
VANQDGEYYEWISFSDIFIDDHECFVIEDIKKALRENSVIDFADKYSRVKEVKRNGKEKVEKEEQSEEAEEQSEEAEEKEEESEEAEEKEEKIEKKKYTKKFNRGEN